MGVVYLLMGWRGGGGGVEDGGVVVGMGGGLEGIWMQGVE